MDTKELITLLGGPSRLGRALGIRSQAVSLWATTGRVPLDRVPALLAIAAERGIQLTANQVRGDFDWQAVCGSCEAAGG